MATKAEVEFWKDMCRKLVGINNSQTATYEAVMSKLNARSEELKSLQAIVDGLEWQVEDLQEENDKLRRLVRHLYEYRQLYFKTGIYPTDHGVTEQRMRELGMEV